MKKYAPIQAEHIARAMLRTAQKNEPGMKVYDSAVTNEIGK
jgi:hypothetical protein